MRLQGGSSSLQRQMAERGICRGSGLCACPPAYLKGRKDWRSRKQPDGQDDHVFAAQFIAAFPAPAEAALSSVPHVMSIKVSRTGQSFRVARLLRSYVA
jgi:hypothetical protein